MVGVPPTEGDAVGPHDVIGHQGQAIHSVQATLLYFCLLAPVCPVHKAKADTALKTQENEAGIRAETFTHLLIGSTTMARGFSRFSAISVFLLLPSLVATEMVCKALSTQ